jgi:ribosomal protein L34
MGRRFESCRAHQNSEVPRLRSGFRQRARTPAKRLKFESCRAHQNSEVPRLRSGFRQRARTPAKRLKFESCRAHQNSEVPRLRSGFRQRARTPAKRLKFESSRAHQAPDTSAPLGSCPRRSAFCASRKSFSGPTSWFHPKLAKSNTARSLYAAPKANAMGSRQNVVSRHIQKSVAIEARPPRSGVERRNA